MLRVYYEVVVRFWSCSESPAPEKRHSQHALASSVGAVLGGEMYQGAVSKSLLTQGFCAPGESKKDR